MRELRHWFKVTPEEKTMGRTRVAVVALFIFSGFCLAFSSAALAEEEYVLKPRYQPNQVLVRYTNEAERVIFSPNSQVDGSSSKEKEGFLDYLRQLFSLSQVGKQEDQAQQIQTIFNNLASTLGIYKQDSLERQSSSSRTIKFKKAKITPAVFPTGDDPLANVYLVAFSKGTVDQAVAAFKQSGLVSETQPNFLYEVTATPNDPQYVKMWDHQKISASDAWDISTGSQQVIAAVVDTGVDYAHPDLSQNMWEGEINGQTTHGWDFVSNDSDPNDGNGHGTHVAGTIGAVGDNTTGVVGINWQVKIMAVRVMDSRGEGSSASVAQGIRFAADYGAKVINLSLGSTTSCSAEVGQPGGDGIAGSSISYATRTKGALVVAAAGNEKANAACFSPANHPDVLAVSATGPNDEPASYSNYGLASWKETKMVAAPGGNAKHDRNGDGKLGSGDCVIEECILSTWLGGGYADIEGTSMAAPHATGLAALVLSKQSMDPFALRQHLVNTADEISGSDKTVPANPNIPGDDSRRSYGKRINAHRALSESADGITVTPTPAGPTPTSSPTPIGGLTPTPTRTGEPSPTPPSGNIAIWTTALSGGSEVAAANGSKLPKGTLVSICYSRTAGLNTLTIDRGGGMVTVLQKNFSQPNPHGCLYAVTSSGPTRFLPLGELASSQGSPHVYTLESGGETVSTTINVTTGDTDLNPPAGPTPTRSPTSTPPGPTATPDPNATATPTPSASDIGQLINQVSETKIREYLNKLVDDDDIDSVAFPDNKQTRNSQYSGNRVEADYIKSHFDSLGITASFQSVSACGLNTRNVIGEIPGSSSNEVYLVTAHMDSMPYDPAPGADDNGSGTAVVMEVARVLKSVESQLKTSLEFVLFSEEEQGLCGSYDYVNAIPAGKIIKGVINLDMIGYGSTGGCSVLIYQIENRDKFLADKIKEINTNYSIGSNITILNAAQTNVANRSDHKRFWDKDKAAIFGFECSTNPNYHTSGDTTAAVNFGQITKLAKGVVGAVASLAMEN